MGLVEADELEEVVRGKLGVAECRYDLAIAQELDRVVGDFRNPLGY